MSPTPALLQLLSVELGERCNLGKLHRECPNSLGRERYARMDTSRELTDADIIDLVQSFYRDHGFRGLVAWHYYNEPLLEAERMFALMAAIRGRLSKPLVDRVPEARFLLWTNGTLLPEDCRPLAAFDEIHVTDYGGELTPKHLSSLHKYCRRVIVQPGHLDGRIGGLLAASCQPCVRPFTEFVVDHFGNVHLCCYDWRGLASPGNILRDGLPWCLDRWAEMVQAVTLERMGPESPGACRHCRGRYQAMSRFDEAAARRAEVWRTEEIRKAKAVPLVPDRAETPPTDFQPLNPGRDRIPPDCTADRLITPHWGQLSKQYHQISVIHEDRPGKPLSDLRLVAVVGTWHEADIVQATVMNCFTQGCDEVLIVDNDSPDNTCLLAEQAGAKIADVFRTDYYLEAVRLHRINRVFVEAAKRHAGNDLWCLAIDADELPQGHSGKTLRQMLRDFGRAYDTVGAVAFDHYPTGEPENVLGKHPADYQPMGMFRGRLGSNEGYWKHPLVFYPAGAGWQNCFSRGMHLPYSLGMAPLRSPVKPILIHHFPFRGRRETYLRLTRLCKDQNGQPHRSVTDDRDISGQGAIRRYRHLDDVYAQRWERIRIPHDQGFSGRLEVKHWSAYFSPEDYEPKRWYM